MIVKEIIFFFFVIAFLTISGIIGEISLLSSCLYFLLYFMYYDNDIFII